MKTAVELSQAEVQRQIQFWQIRKEQAENPAQAQECNRHLFPLYDRLK